MSIVTISEAQANLSGLIHQLGPGQELVITEHNQAIARIIPAGGTKTPQLGSLRGSVVYMAPDFDAPLEDFKEYM